MQKYRSHRKHLLAREAEAASWIHRRQIYGGATPIDGGGKRDVNHWLPPTMGFPPSASPMHHQNHHFRPLHVWGHPTMDQSLMHLWPKHLAPPPPPPRLAWGPPPLADPSFWHHHHHRVSSCHPFLYYKSKSILAAKSGFFFWFIRHQMDKPQEHRAFHRH